MKFASEEMLLGCFCFSNVCEFYPVTDLHGQTSKVGLKSAVDMKRRSYQYRFSPRVVYFLVYQLLQSSGYPILVEC